MTMTLPPALTAAPAHRPAASSSPALLRSGGSSIGLPPWPSLPPPPAPGGRRRPVLTFLAVLLVLGLVVLMTSQRSLLAESVGALQEVHWVWLPVVLVADCVSRAAVALTYRRLLRVGGARISRRAALSVAYAADAVRLDAARLRCRGVQSRSHCCLLLLP